MTEATEIIALSSTFVAAIATLAVVLLSAVLFFVYRSFGQRANTILLIGLNDSGKTTVFMKLINTKSAWPTYTSMTENRFTQYLNQSGVRSILVDVPGAESVRKNLLTKWLTNNRKSVKGIVFVVDSASFSQKCKDVAELLYDVILESNRSIPVIVACNKQDDQLKAKTFKTIATELETEFGLLNVSRVASLSLTGGDDKPANNVLTSDGAAFHWTDLRKRAVRPLIAFVECSAVEEGKGGESNAKRSLDAVRQWIDSF